MTIVDRIRAYGGSVIRQGHTFKLKRGRLTQRHLEWIKAHRVEVMREIWPHYDEWDERAAIMEFDGGLPRDEAERLAAECYP